MQNYLTYGFFLPPNGEMIDLSQKHRDIGYKHRDYCKNYVESDEIIRKAYERFITENNFSSEADTYTDFCVKVLDWCKVGSDIPEKVICYTGKGHWQQDIYDEYISYGFFFDVVSAVEQK